MTWERIQSDLERARRDLLSREIGPGPLTERVANHQARALLLRRVAQAFQDEASRLGLAGLSPQAALVREQAARLDERAAEEEVAAARAEGDQLHAADVERYTALRCGLAAVTRDVAARDTANEIIQSATRLGPAATEALWRELLRRCAEAGLRPPVDLEPRLRASLARAAGDGRPAAEDRSALPPAGELVLAADRLDDDAPRLERDELFDRIVVLAGQLKLLQATDRTLTDAERALVRRGFGILTRISKTHQPGWTATLDSRTTEGDWARMIDEARARQALREQDRSRAREQARREQVVGALRDLHEAERRVVFHDAVERLRARLYELDGAVARGHSDGDIDLLRRDARTQAAIACRAANGDPERLDRIGQLLARRLDVVGDGRVFRPLRRIWGIEELEDEDDATRATADDFDHDEVEFTVGDLDEQWPEEILQTRGAGVGERILLVGGIPNLERKRLLREFFGWSDVSWEESYRDHSADFRTLRGRIRAGAFDRVIVLSRFCGHDATQGLRDVTRRANVAYHVHPRGISIPALARFVYGSGSDSAAGSAAS